MLTIKKQFWSYNMEASHFCYSVTAFLMLVTSYEGMVRQQTIFFLNRQRYAKTNLKMFSYKYQSTWWKTHSFSKLAFKDWILYEICKNQIQLKKVKTARKNETNFIMVGNETIEVWIHSAKSWFVVNMFWNHSLNLIPKYPKKAMNYCFLFRSWIWYSFA